MKKILVMAVAAAVIGSASYAAPAHHHGHHKTDEGVEIANTVLEVINSILG